MPWASVGNPAQLNLAPPPPGMQAAWVQIPQWVAISGFLPFVELEPVAVPYFERVSVLQLSILATAWRRILGALADLGLFGAVHVDEDAFRKACAPKHCSPVKSPCPSSSCSGAIWGCQGGAELFLQRGNLGLSEAVARQSHPWDLLHPRRQRPSTFCGMCRSRSGQEHRASRSPPMRSSTTSARATHQRWRRSRVTHIATSQNVQEGARYGG